MEEPSLKKINGGSSGKYTIYDDALDAFGIHGVGGIFGALATGVLATTSVNPAGANGLLFGNPQQLLIRAVAVLATCIFAGGMTFIILKGLSLCLRPDEMSELQI